MGDGDGDGSGSGKDAPTYRRKGGGVGDCGGGWFEHLRQWLGLHWAGLSLRASCRATRSRQAL